MVYALICFVAVLLTVLLPSFFFNSSPPEHRFMERPPFMDDDFSLHEFTHEEKMGMKSLRLFSPDFSYTFFVFALISLLSLIIRVTLQWQQSEKEKVNAELAFLKAQINPHFLFNTLNNIHSMVLNGSAKTAEAIEVFSDLMRFVIYETRHETIPLINKVQYISNYLTLQRMRLPSIVEINFKVEGNPYPDQIAPMILMTFIENAFKYGVSTENKSVIDIWIEIKNHELLFCVKNPKFRRNDSVKEQSQLGIGNTKKRLDLIYPGRYKLDITETETDYKVLLQIKLK